MLEEPARDRVAGLVVRDDLLLLGRDELVALEPADHAVRRLLKVGHRDLRRAAPRGDDGGLVAQVGDVGAGHARRQAREPPEVLLDRAGEVERLEVHLEDRLAALDVGLVDDDLPVEAAGPRERLVEDVDAIRACEHGDVGRLREAVHLNEHLVERVLALVVAPEKPPRPRWRPTASTSSMKTMHGAFARASLKRSRTRLGPTPTNISIKSEPEME